ncbi:MAG: hypothetical protein JNL42_17360 [Anaerolineae bacterium]|nr:hypothetical protein [Anaerolineae bacterium]
MAAALILVLTNNAALGCSLQRLLSRSKEFSTRLMAQPPADDLAAVNILVESADPIVLLVMRMPAVEDLTILRQLRARFPEVRIIAVLTEDLDDYRSLARSTGASECIVQRDLTTALVPALLRLAPEGSAGSPPDFQH